MGNGAAPAERAGVGPSEEEIEEPPEESDAGSAAGRGERGWGPGSGN